MPQMSLHYKNQELHFFKHALGPLTHKLSVPGYIYDWQEAQNRAASFLEEARLSKAPNPLVCYALKANSHPQLLQRFQSIGLGADVVSGGELSLAINAAISPENIVFSGVGKSPQEINQALSSQQGPIQAFNVESSSELLNIDRLARQKNKTANISLRLNPKVMAKTHRYIATGHGIHKFGMDAKEVLNLCQEIKHHPNLKLVGLSMHIGSQLSELGATIRALKQLCDVARASKQNFHFLDVGGGLGINYNHTSKKVFPSFNRYHSTVMRVLKKEFSKSYPFERVIYEPGRCLVAPCGVLLAQVLYLKKSHKTTFAILNAGMTDLIRPSLYGAHHEIYPLIKRRGPLLRYDIVGPVCESSDVFASKRLLSPLCEGDWVAIADVGAYGFSMSSTYNQRQLPLEIVL